MTEHFDPYHQWLGIPPADQPPTLYRLLGLNEFESDPDVISSAAEKQMAHVRAHQIGPHVDESQSLLNELADARRKLLDLFHKATYDRQLREARVPTINTAARRQTSAKGLTPQSSRAFIAVIVGIAVVLVGIGCVLWMRSVTSSLEPADRAEAGNEVSSSLPEIDFTTRLAEPEESFAAEEPPAPPESEPAPPETIVTADASVDPIETAPPDQSTPATPHVPVSADSTTVAPPDETEPTEVAGPSTVELEEASHEFLKAVVATKDSLAADTDIALSTKSIATLQDIAASEADATRKLALLLIVFDRVLKSEREPDAKGKPILQKAKIDHAWQAIEVASVDTPLRTRALTIFRSRSLLAIDVTTMNPADRIAVASDGLSQHFPALIAFGEYQVAGRVLKLADTALRIQGSPFRTHQDRIKALRAKSDLAKQKGAAIYRMARHVEAGTATPRQHGLLALTRNDPGQAAEHFRLVDETSIADAQSQTDNAQDIETWLSAAKAWESVATAEAVAHFKPYWTSLAVHCARAAQSLRPRGLVKVRVDEALTRLGAETGAADTRSTEGSEPIKLTQLKPISTKVGYGSFAINQRSAPHVSRGARPATEFIFAHAPSRVVYAIPRGIRSFTATGYNDCSRSAGFEVYADQTLLQSFKPELGSAVTIAVDIPANTKTLQLVTTNLGDSERDQTFWVTPRLYRRPLADVEAGRGGNPLLLTTVQPLDHAVGESELTTRPPWDHYVPVLPAEPATEYLFSHAPSRLVYAIPQGAYGFSAIGSCYLSRSVQYQVFADGRLRYMAPATPSCVPMYVPLPTDATELTLVVDSLGSGNSDHSSWCYPEFVMRDDTSLPRYKPVEPIPVGQSVNLLQHVDPIRHAIRGKWTKARQGLLLEPMSYGRLILPMHINQEAPYDVTLEVAFTRLEGNDTVAMMLPVGNRVNIAVNGWPGDGFGSYLSRVDGTPAISSPKVVKGDILPKGPHRYQIRFGQTKEDAFVNFILDKRTLFEWRGAKERLTQDGYWSHPDGTVGIGAYKSKVLYTAIRMQVHDGDVQWLPQWPDLFFDASQANRE